MDPFYVKSLVYVEEDALPQQTVKFSDSDSTHIVGEGYQIGQEASELLTLDIKRSTHLFSVSFLWNAITTSTSLLLLGWGKGKRIRKRAVLIASHCPLFHTCFPCAKIRRSVVSLSHFSIVPLSLEYFTLISAVHLFAECSQQACPQCVVVSLLEVKSLLLNFNWEASKWAARWLRASSNRQGASALRFWEDSQGLLEWSRLADHTWKIPRLKGSLLLLTFLSVMSLETQTSNFLRVTIFL